MSPTGNEAWLQTISDVLVSGRPIVAQKSTGADDKGSYEILAHTMHFDMQYPIVTVKPNTSYRYMATEPLWVIEGSNSLLAYPEIERVLTPYSDNGYTLRGAYGPPFKGQLEYVTGKLSEDINSRQAVITIWQRRPTPSKDIPCTVALQFLIRDNFIHCIVTMRSSDVGKGLPYDMFTFTCMAAEVAMNLPYHVELGTCYITAGSRHIYMDQMDTLDKVVQMVDISAIEAHDPLMTWKFPAFKEKLKTCASNLHELSKDKLNTYCKAVLIGMNI